MFASRSRYRNVIQPLIFYYHTRNFMTASASTARGAKSIWAERISTNVNTATRSET